MKFVKGRFTHGERGTLYTYLCDKEVKVDDIVVVETTNGFSCIQVVEIDADFNEEYSLNIDDYKWVVDVVDMSKFRAMKENVKKRRVIKAQLDKRLKEITELSRYDMLAQDEEGKRLLEEFKSLT